MFPVNSLMYAVTFGSTFFLEENSESKPPANVLFLERNPIFLGLNIRMMQTLSERMTFTVLKGYVNRKTMAHISSHMDS